jgi:hypothetical protein
MASWRNALTSRPTVGSKEALRVVAGYGLDDPEPHRVSIDDEDSQAFVSDLFREKLTGLAVAAVDGGVLELSVEATETLLERHRGAMAWCLRVEERLLEVDDRFRRAGIDYAVLKGPAIAHTAYPDPSFRAFGDLDVLVRGREFKSACLVLKELGFQRIIPEPRRGFDERFGKAATHRHRGDSMEIDLHRTLVLGPFGLWMAPEVLLDHAASFPLGGRRIPRLDDTGTLLSVAMHATLGWPPRLVPLRDVLQVSRVMDVDRAMLAAWAREWRLSAVLSHAFSTAGALLDKDAAAGSPMFIELHPRRGEARALQAYVGERRAMGGTAVSTLRAIPGPWRKAAYVRAMVFPGQEFLESRYPNGSKGYRRRLAMPGRWTWRRLAAVRSKEP